LATFFIVDASISKWSSESLIKVNWTVFYLWWVISPPTPSTSNVCAFSHKLIFLAKELVISVESLPSSTRMFTIKEDLPSPDRISKRIIPRLTFCRPDRADEGFIEAWAKPIVGGCITPWSTHPMYTLSRRPWYDVYVLI
jgi:hypothetical protein